MSFERYWRSYQTSGEAAANPDKADWSPASRQAGIVEAATAALVSSLSCSDINLELEVVNSGVGLSATTPFVAGGLRWRVVAHQETNVPVSDTINQLQNLARESLCLHICPRFWAGTPGNPRRDDVPYSVIDVHPVDMDAIAHGALSPLELAEFKLYRRLVTDEGPGLPQYDPKLVRELEALRAAAEPTTLSALDDVLRLADAPRTWVDHPLTARAVRALKGGRNCLLIGPSSAGKSVLALQTGRSLQLSGQKVGYLNLSSVAAPYVDVLRIFMPTGGAPAFSVVMIDDLQSSPALACYILTAASLIQRVRVDMAPPVLGVTWPDFASTAVRTLANCLPIPVTHSDVRAGMLRAYENALTDDHLDELSTRAGADLLVLSLMLRWAGEKSRVPGLSEVAEHLLEQRTAEAPVDAGATKRVSLVCGSLGRFDIASPPAFVTEVGVVSDEELASLVTSGLLRRQQGLLSMGHRSLCGLFVDWLTQEGAWLEFGPGGPSSTLDIVLDYLRSLGSALAVETLRQLQASVGFKVRGQLNQRAATLVVIWQAFNSIVERIERQQELDPSWGRDASSAMFAVRVLEEVGNGEAAQRSIDFLRRHWRIARGRLTIQTNGLATVSDFVQIRDKMLAEDSSLAPIAVGRPASPGWTIDMERFHRTWLTGVLLTAEASAPVRSAELDEFVSLVEADQLPSGAFYPERVPWCTARVLLGLAGCGRTTATSSVVDRGVKWLLRDVGEGGPCRDGIWLSGTGAWNTEIETTGLVLLALAAVGYDCSDERLTAARGLLLSRKWQWTAPGAELDGALAIDAYLSTGGAWHDAAAEAQRISHWARGEALWVGAGRGSAESLDQSCRVAQIAAHLVNIGWTAIQSDLPAFLDALAARQVGPQGQASVRRTPEVALLSSPSTDDAIAQVIAPITTLSLSSYAIVGRYRRHDEKVRDALQTWRRKISRPLDQKTTARENFLIWAPPGSGKSFFIQEIARQLPATAYVELNLAARSRHEFVEGLQTIANASGPMLCMIDEVDARLGEDWPYQELFSYLDLNLLPDKVIVFVLVGSSEAGVEGLARAIRSRPKGADMLDRVPADRRFEIPALTQQDRVIVVASQVLDAAAERKQSVEWLEKLALYYILSSDHLSSPRQLRDLAVTAVQRLGLDEDRLKYDDLFFRGDSTNQIFWTDHQSVAMSFAGRFIRLVA